MPRCQMGFGHEDATHSDEMPNHSEWGLRWLTGSPEAAPFLVKGEIGLQQQLFSMEKERTPGRHAWCLLMDLPTDATCHLLAWLDAAAVLRVRGIWHQQTLSLSVRQDTEMLVFEIRGLPKAANTVASQ